MGNREEGRSAPRSAARDRRRIVVYLALGGNVAIAASKFVAAALTGSAAMLSEGVHSLVDCSNELLLMYGLRRASAPADIEHPLGHDREIYFWSFVVALVIFALGAGVSIYEGIHRIGHPAPLTHVVVSYVVLGASFAFESVSWIASLRELRRSRRAADGVLRTILESKDPTVFIVFLEDSAALVGLVFAALGITLAHTLGEPVYDAIGSIAIALVLGCTSLFLARETKALLIGEPARPHVRDALLAIAGADPGIEHANGVITVQLGPDRVLAALSAEFRDDLVAGEIEACVRRLEDAMHERHPEVRILFVKPQAREIWRERRGELRGGG